MKQSILDTNANHQLHIGKMIEDLHSTYTLVTYDILDHINSVIYHYAINGEEYMQKMLISAGLMKCITDRDINGIRQILCRAIIAKNPFNKTYSPLRYVDKLIMPSIIRDCKNERYAIHSKKKAIINTYVHRTNSKDFNHKMIGYRTTGILLRSRINQYKDNTYHLKMTLPIIKLRVKILLKYLFK